MKPHKIWAHLDNFFFLVSNWEPNEKCWKFANCFFSIFPLAPLWKLWKRNCLNDLKFWGYELILKVLSWKTPKRVNCRHPYLRKLFPFIHLNNFVTFCYFLKQFEMICKDLKHFKTCCLHETWLAWNLLSSWIKSFVELSRQARG